MRGERLVDRVPFLGAFCVLLLIASAPVEIFLTIGWVLRVLDVPSIFDRWLHGYTSMQLFMAWAALAVAEILIARPLGDGL